MSTHIDSEGATSSANDVRVRTGRQDTCGRRSPRLRRIAPLVLLAIGLAFASPMAADHDGVKKTFTVFTQNAYVGGNLARVMMVDPTDFPGLMEAVTTTYYEILASRPDVRMRGLADRIAARTPDIVALQEMYVLRKQSPGDLAVGGTVPATEVVADFLQLLMGELRTRGLRYRVAATTTETDVEMPMLNMETGELDDARLTEHDVILVRADLPRDQLRVSNPQGGNFDTHLTLDSGLEVLQGWCSVDVSVRGERFRFINTHLQDEMVPEIQFAQAQELMAAGGPADTALPVMIAGDFNADPNELNGTWTYAALRAGGLNDAWSELFPTRPGLTFGHDAGLAARQLAFVWRIDLILYKGDTLVPRKIQTVDTGLGRQESPLWPSDHAGIWASFEIR